VRQNNVEDDFDFEDYIVNPIEEHVKIPTSSFAVNKDSSMQEQILALNVGEQMLDVATLTWPSVGVKPNTWKSWGLGVLRDSRMFRAQQQGPKHLALGCSWCHWKGLED